MDLNERLNRAEKRLAQQAQVPPDDPARLAALLAAFDVAGARRAPRPGRSSMFGAFASAAAAVLVAAAIAWLAIGRHDAFPRSARTDARADLSLGVHAPSAGGFVVVPDAALLPPLESGSLVRMELPVSILPSLGMTPPATGRPTEVIADVIVGQDGLPRAVRLVE